MTRRMRTATIGLFTGLTLAAAPISASLSPSAAANLKSRAPASQSAAPAVTAGGASRASLAAAKKRLVWRDDFTGPAGTAANKRYWNYEAGGSGWGNQELQRYTTSTANAGLDGAGHLAITAREDSSGSQCWYGTCRYTSARLTTQGKVTSKLGRVEARMKLPAGQGLWPAFWMLGANFRTVGHPDCGEVDIMELVGNEPFRSWASVHGPGYTGISAPFDLALGRTFADRFHVFALDRTSTSLTFSVDGKVFHRVTPASLNGGRWVFSKPFFLIMNLAVGGRWPGDPGPATRFPATTLVDYVAVYR